MEFFDCFALADCAARVLAQERPKDNTTSPQNVRMFMREHPVRALRYLWKTGNKDMRTTVAARVLVWLGKDQERVRAIQNRIRNHTEK